MKIPDFVIIKRSFLPLLTALLLGFCFTQPALADGPVEQAIENLVENDLPAYAAAPSTRAKAVKRFYRQRNYAPAWNADADALLDALRSAHRHGIDPDAYPLDELAGEASSNDARATLDVKRTAAFFDYATDLHGGRIDPEDVNPMWYANVKRPDYARMLRKALDTGSLQATLDGLAPQHPSYQQLTEALASYRTLADEGGWPTLSGSGVVRPGDSAAEVATLRARLAAGGLLSDAQASESDSLFDEALAGAVYRFQQQHGLATDSLLGPNTRAALNIPIEERIRQIELNLERWRWLPNELGERYIVVNIPAFRLWAYDGGEVAETMNVVVGKSYGGHSTPVFTETMEHLIFSPFWNIPHSIATEEILPNARGNRSYLVDNNYEIVSHYGPGAEVYDPYATSLDRVASGELRLREKPGPSNALGLVKFMFPNDYAIYLHDTPADHLFDDIERDYSHGCVRVERPADLAAFALSRKPDWTRERIDTAMHDGEWEKVELDDEIPVYILYWTAFVDADGTLQFRDDLYGHDDELDNAL